MIELAFDMHMSVSYLEEDQVVGQLGIQKKFASVTYGNFQYPAKAPVTFIRQPGPSRTKQYEGLIGHDDPRSTIRVISKYGNVKLKE